MTSDEIESLSNAFVSFDKDANGKLNLEEFREAMSGRLPDKVQYCVLVIS